MRRLRRRKYRHRRCHREGSCLRWWREAADAFGLCDAQGGAARDTEGGVGRSISLELVHDSFAEEVIGEKDGAVGAENCVGDGFVAACVDDHFTPDTEGGVELAGGVVAGEDDIGVERAGPADDGITGGDHAVAVNDERAEDVGVGGDVGDGDAADTESGVERAGWVRRARRKSPEFGVAEPV